MKCKAVTESLCDLNERLDIISIANIDYDNVLIVCNVEHSISNLLIFYFKLNGWYDQLWKQLYTIIPILRVNKSVDWVWKYKRIFDKTGLA